jgi:hypothetical protein
LCIVTYSHLKNKATEERTARLQLSNKLKEVIQNEKIIKFHDITPFEWEEMYIFKPYATKKDFQKTLGVSWKGQMSLVDIFFPSTLIVDEIEQMFVFTKDKKVIQYFYYRINDGDFILLTNEKIPKFTKDEAVFKIKEYDDHEKPIMEISQ